MDDQPFEYEPRQSYCEEMARWLETYYRSSIEDLLLLDDDTRHHSIKIEYLTYLHPFTTSYLCASLMAFNGIDGMVVCKACL
jgi:hypothetical protein